jgi:hypothetical protein
MFFVDLKRLIGLGMCHEKLDFWNPEKAIQAYSTSIPLLSIIEFEIPRALPAQTSFTQYRELWRWVERLIFRAITLLARVRHLDDQEGLIWIFFTHYRSCSTHWPPTFRTGHRSIVAVLHLRALVIRFRASSSAVTPTSSIQYEKSPQWLSIARSIIDEYRTILDKCTRFPKAGERNVPVEDLVDLSVAVWEASGAASDRAYWVIDVSGPSYHRLTEPQNVQADPLVGHATNLQLLPHFPPRDAASLRLRGYRARQTNLAVICSGREQCSRSGR